MDLTFHSLTELTEFMDFAGYSRARRMTAPAPVAQATEPPPATDAPAEVDEGGGVDQNAAGADVNEPDPKGEQHVEPEPTKRKRRTKAEMAADAAAEAGAQAGAENGALAAQAMQEAAKSAGHAGGGLLAEQGLQAGNPFAAAPQPAAAAEPVAVSPADLAATASALGEVSAPAHLNACKAYIATAGLAAYNETFKKAGLTPNVLAYTPEQRALHVAALGS